MKFIFAILCFGVLKAACPEGMPSEAIDIQRSYQCPDVPILTQENYDINREEVVKTPFSIKATIFWIILIPLLGMIPELKNYFNPFVYIPLVLTLSLLITFLIYRLSRKHIKVVGNYKFDPNTYDPLAMDDHMLPEY